MPASSSRSTGEARASLPVRCRAEPRARRPANHPRPASLPQADHESATSSATPSTRCMTAAIGRRRPARSDHRRRDAGSASTTAGPSPRYTAARRAERCSFESISLCVVLRCQAQAVAHHPRRERRRLREREPRVLPWRRLCGCHRRDVQAPQYAETPRPSRPSPAPTLAAQLETGSRRDARLRVLEVMGPLPVHASVDSPKPRRQAALRPFSEVRRRGAGGRLSAAAGCGEHAASWSPTVTTNAVDATIGTVALRSSRTAPMSPRRKSACERPRLTNAIARAGVSEAPTSPKPGRAALDCAWSQAPDDGRGASRRSLINRRGH